MVAPKEGTLQALAYFIVPSELPSGLVVQHLGIMRILL
uniref:Uncharacterized protein n=1 Tax=Oryza rufipogon TaxID=4529 RepID=A0A0E0QHD9_ORYRU